jgi:hypothetical protein
MAHNYQASGSGDGYVRPTNINTEEAKILADKNNLVPPVWHLPHGWHVSTGSYAVAPILPEGPLLDDLIEQRWEVLPPARRNLPEWAPTRAIWLFILQSERKIKLGCYFGPYHGRYNVNCQRAYWRIRDIDIVLREHGYHPEYRAVSTPRGWRSVPPTWFAPRRVRGRRPKAGRRTAAPLHALYPTRRRQPVPAASSSGRAPPALLSSTFR